MSTPSFAAAALSSLLLVLFFLASTGTDAARILAVPLPGADSHLFVVTALTDELVKRGHEVLLAVSESDAVTLARTPAKRPFTQLTTYRAAYTKKEMKERVENSRQAVSNPFLGALESLVVYFQALIEYCDTEMSDAPHVEAMLAFLPDLIIGDVISPCGCGLAYKLPMMVAERNITPPASWLRVAAARDLRRPARENGKKESGKKPPEPISIPRVAVAVLPMLDPLLPNIQDNLPNHLGMIPQVGTGFSAARGDAADLDADDGTFTNRLARALGLLGATNRGLMPLWQRCVNVAFYFGAHAIHAVRVKPLYVALGERHGVRVTTSFLHSAPLVLFNSDFAVEAPRPLPPSALFAGSLMSRPAVPLPREPWEELLGPRKERANEPNDVIYASLGTLVTISADEYRAFARGLALLSPTRALWKLSDEDLPGNMTVADLNLAENVKALAWVPQNDLLGDGRLAGFVTHGGINSIYEAAYHGVPVAGIPIFGDQPDNVAKAVAGGWGVMLPLRRLSAERLAAAARKVIGNEGGTGGSSSSGAPYAPSAYRLAALRVSARMRSRRRHPVSDAIDAVEGVLATDGDMYLKTGDHLVPLWRWAMLDVVAVYAAVGLLVRAGVRALFGGRRRRRAAAAAAASAAAAAAAAAAARRGASLHPDDESAPLKPPITPNASPARERRPDTAFGGGRQKPAAFGTSPPPSEGLRARGGAAGAAES